MPGAQHRRTSSDSPRSWKKHFLHNSTRFPIVRWGCIGTQCVIPQHLHWRDAQPWILSQTRGRCVGLSIVRLPLISWLQDYVLAQYFHVLELSTTCAIPPARASCSLSNCALRDKCTTMAQKQTAAQWCVEYN